MPNDRDDVDDESTGTKTIEQSAVESDTTEEECLIVELRLPTDALPFGEALSRLDGVRVEFEQIVPASENPLPYLWVDDGGHGGFEAAVSADPTVERIRHVSDLNGDGGLYELGWTDLESTLLEWFDGGDGTILQLDGEIDEWHVKMRVESRAALGSFQEHCRERGIEFELVRLYRLTEPKMGQFNVSEKQLEALITALEIGYFEIPRDATLGDLADALGVSKRAASERLRRGQTNLVHNSLVIGRPTGIGLN
jgi:hypothetical protein